MRGREGLSHPSSAPSGHLLPQGETDWPVQGRLIFGGDHGPDQGTRHRHADPRVRPRRDADHRRHDRDRAGRHVRHGGREPDGHPGAEALRHRLARTLRLLPPLPRRDSAAGAAPRPPAPRRPKPAWWCTPRHRSSPSSGAASWNSTSPTTRSPASPARPTAIASCRTWRARSGCARCATAMRARTTSRRRPTPRTPISPSNPRSASSAIAASGPARRCRAPSR